MPPKRNLSYLVILKRQLKNIMPVTTLQKKEKCGTDVEVVGLGCTRSVAGGTFLMVTCVTCALMCPVFLILFILRKCNIGIFLLLRLYFSL